MAEPALKLAPQPDTAAVPGRRPSAERRRRLIRMPLLVVLPAIVVLLGVGLYLSGGRYVATDNAYIGAQKVLITPDISGKVQRVLVREGQHVGLDDPLFEIDPIPFQLNLKQAQSKLDTAKTQFASLKSNYSSLRLANWVLAVSSLLCACFKLSWKGMGIGSEQRVVEADMLAFPHQHALHLCPKCRA